MMKKLITSFIVFWCVLLLLSVIPAISADSVQRLMKSLYIQHINKKDLPEFALHDTHGTEVHLKDLRGKIVVINFWATWCPPCIYEMPSMEKLHARFKNGDFALLAINVQDSKDKVSEFIKKNNFTFKVLLDTDGKVSTNLFSIRSIPTTFIIDRNGKIIGIAIGERDWSGKEAMELFENLLNKGKT